MAHCARGLFTFRDLSHDSSHFGKAQAVWCDLSLWAGDRERGYIKYRPPAPNPFPLVWNQNLCVSSVSLNVTLHVQFVAANQVKRYLAALLQRARKKQNS